MSAVPKPRRIEDRKAVEAARKPRCERCGRPAYGLPHHIITQGAGGPDHPLNLVQLCWRCHYVEVPAGRLTRQELLQIVARREHMDMQRVLETLGEVLRGGRGYSLRLR